MVLKILMAAVMLAVAFGLYVRFAPSEPAVWARPDMPDMPDMDVGDYSEMSSFTAVRVVAGPEVLDELTRIAEATFGTSILNKASDDNWLTFVTRSKLWGFPDYTSVRVIEKNDAFLLQIHGRLRFGKADIGVNKARIRGWLDQLGLLTPET